MIVHAGKESGDWLDIAGALAALPHGGSSESFARNMTQNLLGVKQARVHEILIRVRSADRIRSWEKLLCTVGEAELREFFAYRPEEAVRVFAAELDELWRWSTLVEIYEACYRVAMRGDVDEGSDSDMPGAARLSAAHLARTRWVLLSMPFAGNGRPLSADVIRVDDEPGRVRVLAEQAREDWLAVLAAIDDYPQLAGRIGDVEEDIVRLAGVRITGSPPKPEGKEALPDSVGREVAQYAATRLLLPRFAWAATTRIYLRSSALASRLLSAAACAAIFAALIQIVLGFTLNLRWEYTAAAGTAAGVYVLVVLAMAADSRAAWPWLLRQPASAAVGLLALAAFGPGWWFTGRSGGGTARAGVVIAGLAGAALLYLYIEAIGHRVQGRRLIWRPALVGLYGFVHGLLVSLIGLRFLMPVFASGPANGPALSCWYAGSCHRMALPVPALLGLAAAWSLAAGVFLQIVWDDQPVTAPLAHVSWRRGG